MPLDETYYTVDFSGEGIIECVLFTSDANRRSKVHTLFDNVMNHLCARERGLLLFNLGSYEIWKWVSVETVPPVRERRNDNI